MYSYFWFSKKENVMKKIISIAIIALAITMINNSDAKQMVAKKPIPITKNEKQILTDTKNLKNAPTPEKKQEAAKKLAQDIAKDPVAILLTQKTAIDKEIKTKKDEIKEIKIEIEELGGGGYFSYFTTSDELKEMQDYLQDLEDELQKLEEKEDLIHKKLVKIGKAQPKEVFNLKKWAVYSLIGTVGIAGALHLAGIGVVAGAVSLIPSWGAVTSTVVSAVGLGMSALQLINALFFAEYTLRMLKARLFEEENKSEPNQQKIEQLYQQLDEQEEIIAELHKALIAKQAQEKK